MTRKVYINIDALKSDEASIIKYVASDRSDGKTTHIIRMAREEKRKSGKIGVIARRHVGDITTLWRDSLFTNLRKVCPDVGELTAQGSPKKSGVHLFEGGEEFAVLVPLSRADAIKSAFDVATHKDLYIDEYVPIDGRYLKDEVERILEIYRTIDRDTFTNAVWAFSNHLTATNPLLRYFNVTPRDGLSRWKNGRFLMLQCANKGNREAVKKSPLGELVENTPYGEYAAGGTLDHARPFVHERHYKSRYPFVVRGENGLYGFYYAPCGVVIDHATPTAGEAIYTTAPTSGADGGIYLRSQTARDLLYALQTRAHMSEIFVASELIFEDAKDVWKMLTR